MHKMLKRIIALPAIPQDETFEIKSRATEILKSWRPHLDEMAEMQKTAANDGEKSPTKSTHDEEEKPEAKDEMKDDVPEEGDDFVVVEGGESDELAQERAAAKEGKLENGAGAPAETAELMGMS